MAFAMAFDLRFSSLKRTIKAMTILANRAKETSVERIAEVVKADKIVLSPIPPINKYKAILANLLAFSPSNGRFFIANLTSFTIRILLKNPSFFTLPSPRKEVASPCPACCKVG